MNPAASQETPADTESSPVDRAASHGQDADATADLRVTSDGEVLELIGDEGGVWEVRTRDSLHVFDLDAGTVTRLPGPDATVFDSNPPRPLRTIRRCRIGGRGYWTFMSDDYLIDYYWHHSSIVKHIQRIALPSTAPDPASDDLTSTWPEVRDVTGMEVRNRPNAALRPGMQDIYPIVPDTSR